MSDQAIIDAAIWLACRGEGSTKAMMLASCGRIATAVGMGPLNGMSREMVFLRSGLWLGLISPANMGDFRHNGEDYFQGMVDGATEG